MKPYRCSFRSGWRYCAILIVISVTAAVPSSATVNNPRQKTSNGTIAVRLSNDQSARLGFEHFYNMEYDKAVREFEKTVQQHPDDPFALNYLLSGILWRELDRIGALDTEMYANDDFLTSRERPPDPKTGARIKELIERSLMASERRLKANPNDTDALYARGATKAMRSTYLGLIERSWYGALRSALAARKDHERVLQIDPNYRDAKFVVGVHQYIVGSLNWAWKVAASIVGISGNRQKGIEYLYEAANAGGETSVDAKIALSLFLRREQRYKEAIALVGGLMHQYPRNYLVALEHANLLNAAGQGPEAIAAYRRLLEAGKSGTYSDPRLEQAAWGLGEALRGQRDFKGAAEAYESVSHYPHIQPELQGRSSLAAGEMHDLLKQRDLAISRYQAVIAAEGSSPRADIARKRLKKPYQLPKGG